MSKLAALLDNAIAHFSFGREYDPSYRGRCEHIDSKKMAKLDKRQEHYLDRVKSFFIWALQDNIEKYCGFKGIIDTNVLDDFRQVLQLHITNNPRHFLKRKNVYEFLYFFQKDDSYTNERRMEELNYLMEKIKEQIKDASRPAYSNAR
jgi:hypothetical protein